MFGGWGKSSTTTQNSGSTAAVFTDKKTPDVLSSSGTPKGRPGDHSTLSSGSKDSSRGMSFAINSDSISDIDKYDKFLISVRT